MSDQPSPWRTVEQAETIAELKKEISASTMATVNSNALASALDDIGSLLGS